MFYCIDKAPGITSREAVKKLLQIKGRGFGVEGILDPFASGLLIAATGHSTRFLSYFLKLQKTYIAEIQLGAETNTLDNTGDVTKRAEIPAISDETLTVITGQFTGAISQIPPLFSNVNVDGRRAHELARLGDTRELKPREVTVHELKIAATSAHTLSMECRVASGTYVRSLARDIAVSLGTYGHLTSLRRLTIGAFSVAAKPAVSAPPGIIVREMTDFDALDFFGTIPLTAADTIRFLHGAFIRLNDVTASGLHRVTSEGKLLGLGVVDAGLLKPDKVYPTN